jgi:hypothetical protein
MQSKSKNKVGATPPQNLMVIKNNPDYIGNHYIDKSLQYEENNVVGNIGLSLHGNVHNLTIDQLKRLILQNKPDVVHLAGVDPLQAAEIMSSQSKLVSINGQTEGMMFPSSDGSAVAITPEQLARTLCASKRKPTLLGFNFNRSSSIAAHAVARGASSAIAFYNDLDDLVAESFYTNFYLAWRLSAWNVLDAYRLAWSELYSETPYEKLRGVGIVLWSNTSLLEQEKRERRKSRAQSFSAHPSSDLKSRFDDETNKNAVSKALSRDLLVNVEHLKELNYCLLHNNRSLFGYFFIRKIPVAGVFRNVAVEVSLYVGHERLIYQVRKEMRYAIWVLEDTVRIPLTATLPRALKESIYTTLHVKVSALGEPVFEETFRVNLLPIDQWQDDELNRKWLPSFVQPRDPWIGKIVDLAQKYLVALSDDSSAGFTGYQRSEDEVDVQVKALWHALINDFAIAYITPPPSYTQRAQRLRSPSDVLVGKRGTCIDLALLFAAALEYIELYPIIFLFAGHAFAGFYRTRTAHQKVREWVLRNASSEEDAWMLAAGSTGANSFHKVLKGMVLKREIVSVETVCLTQKTSFKIAIERGQKGVLDLEYFVDLQLARQNGVTPLPVVND